LAGLLAWDKSVIVIFIVIQETAKLFLWSRSLLVHEVILITSGAKKILLVGRFASLSRSGLFGGRFRSENVILVVVKHATTRLGTETTIATQSVCTEKTLARSETCVVVAGV
jgi:hypothetical protein